MQRTGKSGFIMLFTILITFAFLNMAYVAMTVVDINRVVTESINSLGDFYVSSENSRNIQLAYNLKTNTGGNSEDNLSCSGGTITCTDSTSPICTTSWVFAPDNISDTCNNDDHKPGYSIGNVTNILSPDSKMTDDDHYSRIYIVGYLGAGFSDTVFGMNSQIINSITANKNNQKIANLVLPSDINDMILYFTASGTGAEVNLYEMDKNTFNAQKTVKVLSQRKGVILSNSGFVSLNGNFENTGSPFIFRPKEYDYAININNTSSQTLSYRIEAQKDGNQVYIVPIKDDQEIPELLLYRYSLYKGELIYWFKTYLGGNISLTNINYTNCSPTSQSGYTITALNHGESQSFTKTGATSDTHGTNTYFLPTTCTNGALSYRAESIGTICTSGYIAGPNNTCVSDIGCAGNVPMSNATINATSQSSSQPWHYSTIPGVCTFSCNANYIWNSGISACISDSKVFTCSAKPAVGTIWNTVSNYTQTWGGGSWSPVDSTTVYDTTPSTTACNYQCGTNYTWNGTICVADTQVFTCSAKPAVGTIWNTVSNYTQTWNGSSWLPANSTTVYDTTPSTTACNYQCNTNYTWNGTICVADTQTATCGSLPANATASTAATYTQTWNGSSWAPVTSWTYGAGICGYACAVTYTWNGTSCVSIKTATIENNASPTCGWGTNYVSATVNAGNPTISISRSGYESFGTINSNSWYISNPWPNGGCSMNFAARIVPFVDGGGFTQYRVQLEVANTGGWGLAGPTYTTCSPADCILQ